MTILSIDHVQLAMPAGGESEARVFYGQVLGLREIPKPPTLAARGGVWFGHGAVQVHLGVEADFRPARKAHVALLVDDLDAIEAACRDAGAAPQRDAELPGYARFYVADPFGNRLEFLQPQAVSAPERRAYAPRGAIVLTAHDGGWAAEFTREAAVVRDALGDVLLALHHIGSTAVPGLVAKPVIDMLAVVTTVAELDQRSPNLERLGYEARGEFGIAGRRYFPKTTASGVRTHQIHAYAVGAGEITRHLEFRDYLRAHPADAADYAELKGALARQCGTDVETYADGKTTFIREIERRAAIWRQTERPHGS